MKEKSGGRSLDRPLHVQLRPRRERKGAAEKQVRLPPTSVLSRTNRLRVLLHGAVI
jgi:hypothetical protein